MTTSPRNILVFSHFAGTPDLGMVFRNHALAREWVRLGHSVTLVACAYSHFRRKQPKTSGRITRETIDGIDVIWVWGPAYSQASNLGRVASMALFTLQCLWLPLPLGDRYDLVVCSSPHPFSIYPAARQARRFGAKLIYDIRDLWPLTLKYLGGISGRHPFIRLMQAAEDYACRHADLVTAVPQNSEKYLIGRGLRPGRFLAIPNGAMDTGESEQELPDLHQATLTKLRESGAFLIGYAGTLGIANAMDTIVDAIAKTPARVVLVIIGGGGCQEDLAQQAQRLGCADRVIFLPHISRHQVISFLRQVDVGYAATQKSELYELGVSLTKLNDYMLARLPILYGVGDTGNAVERSGGGICCLPGDAQALAEGIKTLLDLTPAQRLQMGEAGYEWCRRHQMVDAQAARILDAVAHLPSP